ncbi:hypothetical protein [Salana multivorans]
MRHPNRTVTTLVGIAVALLAGCTQPEPTPSPTTATSSTPTPTQTTEPTPTPEPTEDPTQVLLDEATAFIVQVMADSDAAAKEGYRTELADIALAHYAGDARAAQVAFIEAVHEYNLTQVGDTIVVDVQLLDLEESQYGPALDLRVCVDSSETEILRDGQSQGGEPRGRTVVQWSVAKDDRWLVHATGPMEGESC